jgi:chromosome segregation ATPase
MKKQLSAKDKAFEKERAEFRKQIRELNHELNSVKFELCDKIHNMQRELDSKNNEIKNMQMVIDELKMYAKLSDDELKTLLEVKEFDKKMYGYFSKIFKEGLI